MIKALLYWRGLRWLKWGWCPWCYSSPPRPQCPVCHGDDRYFGSNVDEAKRTLWRKRFKEQLNGLYPGQFEDTK